MKSLRLEAVASLVKKNCNVLDVGTDHAYLPIILSKTGKCQSIIASDVSNNALSYGEANLKKYHITNVKLVLSDGLKNIRDKYDTLTICGMGTCTIIDILKSGYLPKNIIISSNNDLYTLRCYLNSINYKIINEIIIYENGKYYDIYDGKAKLILEFNENGGRFYEIETRAITNVDTKNKSFTFSVNSRDFVVTYDLKAGGNLKYDTGSYFTSSNKNTAYKKDSGAYKKALKITK